MISGSQRFNISNVFRTTAIAFINDQVLPSNDINANAIYFNQNAVFPCMIKFYPRNRIRISTRDGSTPIWKTIPGFERSSTVKSSKGEPKTASNEELSSPFHYPLEPRYPNHPLNADIHAPPVHKHSQAKNQRVLRIMRTTCL